MACSTGAQRPGGGEGPAAPSAACGNRVLLRGEKVMRFAGAGKPATGPDCASCLHLWMKRGNTLRFVKVMEEETGPKKEDVLCNGLINAGVSPPQPAAPQGADTGDCCMALQGPSAAPVGGLCAPPRPPLRSLVTGFVAATMLPLLGEGYAAREQRRQSPVG